MSSRRCAKQLQRENLGSLHCNITSMACCRASSVNSRLLLQIKDKLDDIKHLFPGTQSIVLYNPDTGHILAKSEAAAEVGGGHGIGGGGPSLNGAYGRSEQVSDETTQLASISPLLQVASSFCNVITIGGCPALHLHGGKYYFSLYVCPNTDYIVAFFTTLLEEFSEPGTVMRTCSAADDVVVRTYLEDLRLIMKGLEV